MEIVQKPHARNLVRWAEDKPEVVVLSADLTGSCEADDFRDANPDRFFSMGMAEQNMMGFAAGMAREGFFPFVHTFAVFICRRPYDQVAMSIAYPNLPVRFLGFLPGVATPGGVTHQAIDDLALMRALPNLTVFSCGDATEVESVLDAAQSVDGPVYIRMLRGEVPRLFATPMVPGKSRFLARGREVLVISEGICTEGAMRAVKALRDKGADIGLCHVSTIKPFDDPELVQALSRVGTGVVVVENHSIIGGLGSAMAETISGHGVGTKLVRLGLQDRYAHGASKQYLMAEYGLDGAAVVSAVSSLLQTSFDIGPEELAATDLSAVPAAPEDL